MNKAHTFMSVFVADDTIDGESILEATMKVLRACQANGTHRSPHVHRIFRSVNEELCSKPLRIIHPNSEAKYFTTWLKFILYMLRNAAEPQRTRLKLTDAQQNIIMQIQVVLQEQQPINLQESLQQLILNLSLAVIKQEISGDAFDSLLVHWLGIIDFDPTQQIWRTPAAHRPSLSQVVYCMRILGLHDALGDGEVEHATTKA